MVFAHKTLWKLHLLTSSDKSKGYASTFMKNLYAGDVQKLQKTRGSREAGEAAGSTHARPAYGNGSLGQPVMEIFAVDSRKFVVTVLEKQPCTEKGIFMKLMPAD